MNRILRNAAAWSGVIGLLVSPCAAFARQDQPASLTGDPLDAPLEPEQQAVSAPSAPADDASQEQRLQTVVDLSFTGADLRTVLNSLARTYGLNIVMDDTVTGSVTLVLRGVTLDEGLRQILKSNGFSFTVRGGIVEVARIENQRAAGVISVKYISLDTALEFLLPLASEGGVLKVDETSNGILVSDYMSRIEQMRSVIRDIDQPPEQVLIESRLMDITHTDLDNLGLQLSQINLDIPLKSNQIPLLLSGGALSMAGPSTSLTGGQAALSLARGDDSFTATIDALIRDQKVKVIATPAILTLNNIEARIIIGEKFPIREQTQTTTGTLETTRFVDVGTTLRVTPRITPDGYVQMHLHPEVSSVSATLDEGPRITTREADTTVLVKDGQPIVIGGLLQEDETSRKGRIPILSAIPFLGLLFQNRSKDHTQKELVIVITPVIVHAVPSLKEPKDSEVHQVATRIGVYDIFSKGQALEEGTTLQARQMPVYLRYLQAADYYQRVVDRFPTHRFAEDALWRLGRISMEQINDLDRAEEAYQRLITQYPDSRYAGSAQRRLKSVRWQRDRIARKGLSVSIAGGSQNDRRALSSGRLP